MEDESYDVYSGDGTKIKEVQHIAVSPPEYQKYHAKSVCPSCGYMWNPNMGFELIDESVLDEVHDHVYEGAIDEIANEL